MRVLVLIALVLLAGCATVEDRAEENAERVGKAVKVYCEKAPETVRAGLRGTVNEEADPHSIKVECSE